MTPIRRNALTAGLLYLLFAALGPFVLIYAPSTLVAAGNASATAQIIATHETLLRLGIAADVVGGLLGLVVALALYQLFVDVDKVQAALVVILGGILPCAIYCLNSLNWVAALVLVHGDAVAQAFSGPQRDELVMLFMRLHHYGIIVNFVFAGLWLFPLGVLSYKSNFIPKVLGVWLVVNGVAYVVQSAAAILFPSYQDLVQNISFPIQFGEVAFLLWLLALGAGVARTREPA